MAAALALAVLLGAGAARAQLLYPDLKTLPPRDLRFDRTDITAESLGILHNVLRFSNTVYNVGEGPLELRAKINQSLSPPSGQAYQRVYESGGGYKEFELPGSTIYYHAVHKHYHFEHWGAYQLWTKAAFESWIASGRSKGEPYLIGQKTTSCVEDEEFVVTLPDSVWPAVYVPEDCGPNSENEIAEGLSPSWGDTYDWYRFEQWIDLGENGSLANGTYVLRSIVNPDNIIYESPEKSDPSRQSAEANEATTTFKVTNGKIEDGDQSTGTVTINHIDKVTSSPQVTLEVLGRDDLDAVDEVRVSNDGKSWKTYPNTSYDSITQTIPWELNNAAYGGSEKTGLRTVYVQFHDPEAGWGPTEQDTIEYEPPQSTGAVGYAKTVEADAPISWWRLGESSGTVAADQEALNPGSYLGGTTLGAPSLVATEPSNTAVAFDGTKGTVQVASSTSLNLSSPFTLEAWIKPAALPASGSFASILTKAESYSLQFNGPSLEFTVIQSGTRHRLQAPSGTIVAGNVYYVVGTYDGTTQRLYVNGTQVASASLSGGASVTTNPLYLGSWNGGGEFLQGTIDEAAVYGKALSATRIAEHYGAGTKVSLAAPSSLTANVVSGTQVNLSWADNATGETGVVLQRATESSFSSPTSISLPAGTHAYSDTGLTPGATYWYRVLSTGAGGASSPYSDTAQATTTAPTTYKGTVLADRPLSYWRLDDTSGTVAGDATVANPGTYVGSPTLGVPGLIASEPADDAVSFNGTTSDVRIGQAGALDFTTALTFEAWISPSSLPPAGTSRSVLSKPGSFALQIDGSAPAFTILAMGLHNTVTAPQGTLTPGGVYHLVGTYDGANERLYVNGVQVASAPLTGSPEQSLQGMYIGSWDGASEFFAGTIDEAAVFPSVLSPERIAAHYAASGAKLEAPSGLSATAASSSRIELSWSGNPGGETGVVLQRSTEPSFPNPTTIALPAGSHAYTDTGLSAGATYWYRVKAVSGESSSEWSASTSAKTQGNGPSYASAVAEDAPVSWWRLGESAGTTAAADQEGLNPGTYLTGTTLGAASLVPTEPSNSAVTFDGAKGAVQVASSASLNLSSPFSLEAWIKPSKLPAAGSFASILTKAESYSLQLNGPSLELTVIQSGTRHRLQAPSGTIVAGNVYYVVGTYDGTTQRLYVNGVQVASASLSGGASVTTNPLYLGSWRGGEEFFTGVIDEAAVYGKALSAARVAEHFAAATKVSLPAPTGLSAKAVSSTQVNLSWSDSATGETGVVLQRAGDQGFSAPVSISLPAGTTSYSDTGLTPGTTYWYRVESMSGASASPWSSSVSAKTQAGGPYTTIVSEDAPVSWWRLGESAGMTAADQEALNPGAYLTGTTLGAASLLPAETSNTAVAFDGAKGAVRVASSSSLNLTSPLTLEAWIKPSKLPAAGSFASVLTKAESYSLQFNGPTLEFTVIQSGTRHRLKAPSGAIAAGSVYYIVGTYDGTTQRLYVNGTQVASASLSGGASVTTNPLYLGSWAGGEEFFAGTLDEVAVYNKALTSTRVTEHYTAGTA